MKIETKFDIGEAVLFLEHDGDSIEINLGRIVGITRMSPEITYEVKVCASERDSVIEDEVLEKHLHPCEINDNLVRVLKIIVEKFKKGELCNEDNNEKY